MVTTLSLGSVALCLLAASAAAGRPGLLPSHLQLPAASVHVHRHLVGRALRDGEDVPRRTTNNKVGARLPRRGQAVDDTAFGSEECPGTPMLWKIVETSSGKHVGFGLGTMHLPVDVVTTDGAYASILAAIEGESRIVPFVHRRASSFFANAHIMCVHLIATCVAPFPKTRAMSSES